ncbi:HTH-type transcriptional activator RhaR [Paraburkholderia caffeinitolerans]|uniref:HTH-type transcriptional activator RhaR n=1 Tax=Paraburkholderia caffeinitolerans TaxID=1723730 RepID=A0A6J5FF93_9BURK|nr:MULTISPECIES: helix-turn-helix domain-containing protein [Paraburkholderia]CAB3778334.1 HTH-type transcriptional activator RhaR [Paraburkholderia caffeinitolerans]
MATHYSVRHYADAGEHAQHLANIKQQYFQIEKGQFGSTLEQFDLDGLHFFSERVNRRVVQCGHISAGMIGIGWFSYASVAPTSRGREITNRTISSARSGSDWVVHLPSDATMFGITLAESEFEGIAEHLRRATKRRDAAPHMPMPFGEASPDAVRRLNESVGQLRAHADRLGCPATRYALRKALLDEVCQAMEALEPAPREDLTRLTYSEIIRRSQDYVMRHAGSPVTVLELCTELRVSRRTLQTCFREITGESPADYLRAVRLCGVRRMLRETPAARMNIASIATRWGFVHLGKFASNYHRLFGELPSQTPRVCARA